MEKWSGGWSAGAKQTPATGGDFNVGLSPWRRTVCGVFESPGSGCARAVGCEFAGAANYMISTMAVFYLTITQVTYES